MKIIHLKLMKIDHQKMLLDRILPIVLNLLFQLSIFRVLCNHVRMFFLEGAESSLDIQKRKPSSDADNESSSKYHRGSYGKNVPTSVHVMLERKAAALEAQILEYQTSLMRE
jgi:hypothetical protein